MAVNSDKFVIVGGMPRSGTRQFTDFLNRSSKFHLEGELFDEVDAAASLVEKVFRRQLKYLKSFPDFKDPHQQSIATNTFERRRREMLVYLVNFLSKSTKAQSQADIIYGFKNPDIEVKFLKLNQLFGVGFCKIYYIYCIRNVADSYLSNFSRPWFKQRPEEFIEKYLDSLKNAVRMRKLSEQSTDPRFSIHVMNLDSFIESSDKAQWLSTRLFANLDVNLSRDETMEIVQSTPNNNATKNRSGTERSKILEDETAVVFKNSLPALEMAISDFNEVYSENLELRL